MRLEPHLSMGSLVLQNPASFMVASRPSSVSPLFGTSGLSFSPFPPADSPYSTSALSGGLSGSSGYIGASLPSTTATSSIASSSSVASYSSPTPQLGDIAASPLPVAQEDCTLEDFNKLLGDIGDLNDMDDEPSFEDLFNPPSCASSCTSYTSSGTVHTVPQPATPSCNTLNTPASPLQLTCGMAQPSSSQPHNSMDPCMGQLSVHSSPVVSTTSRSTLPSFIETYTAQHYQQASVNTCAAHVDVPSSIVVTTAAHAGSFIPKPIRTCNAVGHVGGGGGGLFKFEDLVCDDETSFSSSSFSTTHESMSTGTTSPIYPMANSAISASLMGSSSSIASCAGNMTPTTQQGFYLKQEPVDMPQQANSFTEPLLLSGSLKRKCEPVTEAEMMRNYTPGFGTGLAGLVDPSSLAASCLVNLTNPTDLISAYHSALSSMEAASPAKRPLHPTQHSSSSASGQIRPQLVRKPSLVAISSPGSTASQDSSSYMAMSGSGMGGCGSIKTSGSPSTTPSGGPSGTSTSSSPGDPSRPMSPSQLCAVCGDNAACQHYGVRTCEGCKGFFKRTVQKNAKYVCLGNKDCPVDKRRRNRCQYCRMSKCIAVGMNRDVVRTDNLKGRRGRLPSKPKSPQASPPSPPVSTITALVRAHCDTTPDISSLDYSQFRVVGSAVSEEETASTSASDSLLIGSEQETISSLFALVASNAEILRLFADKIPLFGDLCKEEQDQLLLNSYLELFSLRLAYQMKDENEKIALNNGLVLHRSQVARLLGGDWLDAIESLARQMGHIALDISAFACLEGLAILQERSGARESDKMELIQGKILSSLRDHCTYNVEAQKKPHYFSHILSQLLPNIRSLGEVALQRLAAAAERAREEHELEELMRPEVDAAVSPFSLPPLVQQILSTATSAAGHMP